MPADAINIANKYLKKFFSTRQNLLIDRRNGLWELNPDKGYSTGDGKGNYVIYPFPVEEEFADKMSSYPIYIAISIGLNENNEISKIGIKLFKDDLKKQPGADYVPTELLLRSEWDNAIQDNEGSEKHAQPHWHIHAYTVDDTLNAVNPDTRDFFLKIIEEENALKSNVIGKSIMDDEDTVVIANQEPVKDEIAFPMFKFHLAMVADWDVNSNTHNKVLDCAKLEKWLPQCLGYIKYQVEYILGKLPG